VLLPEDAKLFLGLTLLVHLYLLKRGDFRSFYEKAIRSPAIK